MAGTMPPAFLIQFSDSNGDPLGLGSVTTYLAGTSTPESVYQNVTLATAFDNPYTLPASGKMSMFLTPGKSYKFVVKNAAGTTIDTIDNVKAIPEAFQYVCDGRLTFTTATPITTADVTGASATTVYFTPHNGNQLALYNGSSWQLYQFTERSIAVPASTAQMYDVFIYDNSGTLTLELEAWTNDTTRAVGRVRQDGVVCKSGALTRRFLGSFRTTGVSGQSEDSIAKRYLSNYYHRVPRLLRVTEATNSWTQNTAAWVQANASTANQVDVVVCAQEMLLSLTVRGQGRNDAGAASTIGVGIGKDGVTLASGVVGGVITAFDETGDEAFWLTASLHEYPVDGRHYYTWIDYGNATSATFIGDNGGTVTQTGIFGWIEG